MATAQTEMRGRWLGIYEGIPEKAAGAGGVIYDFRFDGSGKVLVEKSSGTYLTRDTMDYTVTEQGIRLSGGQSLPELSSATFTRVTPRRYDLQIGEYLTSMRPFSLKVSWLSGLFLLLFLIAVNETTRFSKVSAYIAYFILPFAMIPLWLDAGIDHWFRWVKLYSAVAGALFFSLMRFTGIWKKKWARITVAAILAINIAEAVAQDFDAGAMPNIINGVAGILNIVTISGWMTIHRDPSHPHDMLWPGMTKLWIIAYDVWNICFSYLNFPNTVFFVIIKIIAPTLTAFYIKEGTWLQARAYTLAVYFMLLFTLRPLIDRVFEMQLSMPLWRNNEIIWGLALFSLAINVWYAYMHFRWRFAGKAPANLEVGQNESATGRPLPAEARLVA